MKDNYIEDCGLPLFFRVANREDLELGEPESPLGQSVRAWVRSLSVMQKEALVLSAATGQVWRLTSDEGPYLNGNDAAPCPLSFLTTGMVSAWMNEFRALAAQRGLDYGELRMTQDNYYTMEGSLPRGTMVGGALPVDLEIAIETDASEDEVRQIALDAVSASPLDGLMRVQHDSLFTLTHNGEQIEVGRVNALDGAPADDIGERFSKAEPAERAGRSGPLVQRVEKVQERKGVAGGAGTSLEAEQSRRLHVHAVCELDPSGVKVIRQELHSPLGSTFRFLSDEAEGQGGEGRAPDAATYMAAGIGFCFMTQIGRYAKIRRKKLDDYRIVQDTHFSPGGASGGTGKAGEALPVETHVYLRSSHSEQYSRDALDMGEQTCFLHAFCRTPLKTRVRLKRIDSPRRAGAA